MRIRMFVFSVGYMGMPSICVCMCAGNTAFEEKSERTFSTKIQLTVLLDLLQI